MNELRRKLDLIAIDESGNFEKEATYIRDNRAWLERSAAIAVRVILTLKAQQLTQKELAERLKISPQQVSKILHGKENLTLQTISALEKALGIELIHILSVQLPPAATQHS